MTTMADVIGAVLRREGDQYTDHPADRGGPTKYGITLRTLSRYRGRECTPDDVRNLGEVEARNIYFTLYCRGPGFNRIQDQALMALAVDCAVLHGQDRAIKWIQEVAGATKDGVFGPATAMALDRVPPREAYMRLLVIRFKFIGRLVTDNPTQSVFAAGWINRVCEFMEELK